MEPSERVFMADPAHSGEIGVLGGSALVILNPVAGESDSRVGDDVQVLCRKGGMAVDVITTARRGEAVKRVAQRVREDGELSLVIAVGGDGTVREVAEGMVRGLGRWPGRPAAQRPGGKQEPALFIVPSGTGNSMYRAMWAGVPWTDAMGRVLKGDCRVRTLDLARFVEDDSAVFLGTSIGLTARITELASQLRHVPGRQRYWMAAASTLTTLEPVTVDVHVDGRMLHRGPANIVAIGGGRHRAGVFQLLPRSILDDGLLDICVVGELAASEVEPFAELIPSGQHLERPEVRYAQGTAVSITRVDDHPLLVEVDGDIHRGTGHTVTLEVIRAAVPAVVPHVAPAG
jgi:diacylglycerol kinase (ATP)